MRYYLAILTVATLFIAPFPTPRSHIAAGSGPPRATVLGYSREEFGQGWADTGNGCTTRTEALALAFGGDGVASISCSTPYTSWGAAPIDDPYTGTAITPADVELDHLIPLSAAWDLGAHAWPRRTRIAFANDPRNLVVVSAAANQEKSDQLPSEWMPPARRKRCAYSHRLADVAQAYRLVLPAEDLRAMRRSCAGFSGLIGTRSLNGSQVHAQTAGREL